MINKPKYSIWKNANYAIEGFFEVLKNETSFKIEIAITIVVWIGLFFAPMPFIAKSILALSMFIVIIAELGNSAIERTVDLVTKKHHTLAKHAKDAGSAMVLFSVILTMLIWVVTIYIIYFS